MNPADAKLRAHTEALQHTAIVQSEKLVKMLDAEVRSGWNDLLRQMVAGSQRDGRELRTSLMVTWQAMLFRMRQGLTVIASEAYEASVHGWARSVPRSQWRAVLGRPIPESIVASRRASLLEKKKDAFDYLAGPLEFEPEFEPAIGKLSDDDMEELLKSLLFEPPNANDLAVIVNTSQPGRSSWPEKLQREGLSFDQIARTITDRLASGGNVQDVAKEVLPLVNGVKSRAERIARTEGLRVANTMQRRVSQQADDLIAGYQIIATLDQYTRPHHAARNGTIFWKQGQGPVGAPTVDEMPELPDEPNCRCYSAPVLAEPEEFKQSPEFAAEFETIGGSSIPDPAAYDDWFTRQDVDVQKQAVGKARFAALRKRLAELEETRSPDWLDFINPQGELLSREQIKSESPSERAERRAKVNEILRRREAAFRQVSGMGFTRGSL